MARRLSASRLLLALVIACGDDPQLGGEGQAGEAGQSGSSGYAGSSTAGTSGLAGAAGLAGGSGTGPGGAGSEAAGGSGTAGAGQGGGAGAAGISGSSGQSGAAGASGGMAGGAGAGGVSVPPSTGNVGWVGGACEVDADCLVDGGRCQRDGHPNGYCTAPCSQFCPDRMEAGDTGTFCVDGSPLDMVEGACFSRCDEAVFPGTGCAPGYECVNRNRYGEPAVIASVCVPARPAGACSFTDDLLLPLDYPDAGMIWVPAEARCGGALDLVVMLHGINPDSHVAPSLGGGRHLEVLTRGLIDAGEMRPVVLAEPVHFQGSSTALYGAEFSPETHLDKLRALLEPLSISLASLSYIGHSGAGCDANNGLYKVLKRHASLVPAYAPSMPLWGLEDVCYAGAYHWQAPLATLGPTSTAIINMFSVQGDPSDFEEGLLTDAEAMPCHDELYASCVRSATRPWCSYRTRSSAGIGHDNNPYFFVREVFPQVFAAQSSKSPCQSL